MENLIELQTLIGALKPWLDRIVLIGGSAHSLHRLSPLAKEPKYSPIFTKDADLAFSNDEPLKGDIGNALKEAGFNADLRGDRTPPVSHYCLDDPGGFYAEFLVPLKGGRTKSDGSSVPLTITAAGIVAQRLRYLELLLLDPWSIDMQQYVDWTPLPAPTILIPNPATFLAQKLLIYRYREDDKRAQDALYIHDTIELFVENLAGLRSIWSGLVAARRVSATIDKQLTTLIRRQYHDVTDVHRDAANIPQDRNISPEVVRYVCETGLKAIFPDKS